MVKALPSNVGGAGLIPGRGAKHMSQGQKTKTWNRNNIVTNLIDFKKIVHIEKKKATEF